LERELAQILPNPRPLRKGSKKYLTSHGKIEYYSWRLYLQGNPGEKEVVMKRSVGVKGGGDSDL
jgi:hypothetical protein